MSNKDVAIYMIPAGCTFTALLIMESCLEHGKLWITILLLAIAAVTVLIKEKTPARLAPRADVKIHKYRAYCSTGRR